MTRGRGRRKDILGRLGTIFIDSLTEGMIRPFVLYQDIMNESILSYISFSACCFCFVSLILFSMLCFHCRFLFVCFFVRKCCGVSGFMLLFSGRVFPFWLVCFCFLFCIFFFVIFCFCSGEKLLLHRGFGKFGKSLNTYGFHFFKFVSEWTDLQMQFVEGGRVGPFV